MGWIGMAYQQSFTYLFQCYQNENATETRKFSPLGHLWLEGEHVASDDLLEWIRRCLL